MTEETKSESCVAPAAGPLGPRADQAPEQTSSAKEETEMTAFVGKEAPDFEAAAYHQGGFKNIQLSDFRGKWVFLCFYPGDFTFV